MRTLLVVFCLLSPASIAYAAPCSESPPGRPCTPDPGEETETVKSNILGLIKDAQDLNDDVNRLEAEYRAVRDRNNPPATTHEQLDAIEPYRKARVQPVSATL